MRAWWSRLAPRERVLLAVAALLLGGSLLYAAAWRPLADDLARQHARRAVLEQDLAWMLDAGQRLRSLRAGGAAAATAGSMLAQVDRSARASGIKPAIRQLNPEGERVVRVSLDAVEFNRLLRWLGSLQKQGIGVGDLQLTRQDAAGSVQGRLTLERG